MGTILASPVSLRMSGGGGEGKRGKESQMQMPSVLERDGPMKTVALQPSTLRQGFRGVTPAN